MNPNAFCSRIVTGFAFFGVLLSAPGGQAMAAPRTNILLINTDDHHATALGALGNPTLQTPNLDRLVERGFVFRNAYTMGSLHTGAVCLPSRTQLLTGRSVVQVTRMLQAGRKRAGRKRAGRKTAGVDATLAPDASTFLPRVLAAAGYETYHIGKSGNEFGPGINAFEHNVVRNDRPVEERRLSSRRHADAVIEFLRARKPDRPFFIYFAPPVPHDPRVAEEQFHRMYDPARIPLPASYLPQHPFDNGHMTVRDEKLLPWPRTEEAVRQELADYYACVTGLDYHLGRVFECLRGLGQYDHTLIIFTGDNGLSLGEHGLLGKQNLYEFGGMHVPLVFAGPGIPKGESRALAYHLDLLPTLCDFTGAQAPAGLDGKSLAPILRGEVGKVRDFGFTAYLDVQRAIRDDRWKLIRYPQINKTQLFDLQADPHELQDLAARPERAAKVRELVARLEQTMRELGDSCPLTVPNPKPPAWTPPRE